MDKKKFGLIQIFFITLSFLLLFMNCKSQSTAPEMPEPGGDNSISVSCSPSTGGTGTKITLTISVNKNQKEIKAFGFEMKFDSAVFKYLNAEKGTLTGSWAAVDANVTNAGNLIAGGFVGSGTAVAEGSGGILIQFKLKVIYSGSNDNFTSQIVIKNYQDDISGMLPKRASVTFTYKK
jgi:hypothetical protein